LRCGSWQIRAGPRVHNSQEQPRGMESSILDAGREGEKNLGDGGAPIDERLSIMWLVGDGQMGVGVSAPKPPLHRRHHAAQVALPWVSLLSLSILASQTPVPGSPSPDSCPSLPLPLLPRHLGPLLRLQPKATDCPAQAVWPAASTRRPRRSAARSLAAFQGGPWSSSFHSCGFEQARRRRQECKSANFKRPPRICNAAE
jgi:hypothetical protein